MQQLLKQSTAFTTIVGPILDSTGAAYTSAVIGDLNITKNGTTAEMAAAATLTHDHNGHYILVGTTGNSDTLGRLDITCNKSTYAMPPKVFEVLAAAPFDTLVTNGTLASTTSGRTITTDAAGLVDANTVKIGPTGAGTAQTARDIGTSVLLSSGTGTGQLDFTSGVVKTNVVQLLGTAWLTPGTAGTPDVNVKLVGGVAQTGGDIYPAVTNIGVTSAALNKIADSRTITTGTGEANTYTSTAAADGTYHSISDSAGTIDFYYEATLPTTGGALTGVNWLGYVVGVANTIKVYIYNWTNSGWDQVGSVVGIAGTVNMDSDFDATNDHTGTGGNALKVRFRFSATGLTAATVKTDRLLFGYAVVATYQSGDAFALIGSTGSGLTSLAPSATALSNVQWTNTLATNLGTLASHDPGATLGTSTLTQTQVTGGAYALNNASFAFNAGLDFTTTQKAATLARVTLTDTATTLTNLPAITAGWLSATGIAADAITAAKIADGAIDSATFAADTGLQSIRSNTAASGAASTITLDASASSVNDFYKGRWIRLTGGTGSGQVRLITSYVGSTQVATVHTAWATNPDNTTTFAVINAADIQSVVLVDTTTTNTDMLTASGVWAAGTRTLTAGTNIVLSKGTGVTGFNDIAAADVWSVGTRTLTGFGFQISSSDFSAGAIDANAIATDALGSLELAAGAATEIATAVASQITTDHGSGSYLTATGFAVAGDAMTLTSAYNFAKGTVAMTESYNADGSAPTPAQALFVIMQALTDGSISGSTWTIRKIDGSTTAFTMTLDSATNPTSVTRTT